MTPVEIRLRAASLIEERGWTQEEFEGPGGQLCALGAILVAANEPMGRSTSWGTTAATEAVTLIEDELDVVDLSNWNDAPARTQAEVVAALRGQLS